jgi:ABC-type transport system substrate-binding protein
LGAGSIWGLDPKSKEFGPNAKYYQFNVAEAKKLLAAAGHPNGLDVTSYWPAIVGEQQTAVLDNMAAEAGFRVKREFIDSNVLYPKYRDAQGRFDGWAHIIGSGLAIDPVALFTLRYTRAGGSGFLGFDTAGKGDSSGDPQVEELVKKANLERETGRKREIVHEIQRYLAKAQYMIPSPGQFSGFDMAWPALRNFGVWQGRQWYPLATTWIDDTQPPLKKA